MVEPRRTGMSMSSSGSHLTPRWREMDSNFRSPVRRTAFSRLPVRITRPSCYADERSAEHRTPAGAGELGGRAKEPVSVKGELRGIEPGPQKVVSLSVRIHGAARLKRESSPKVLDLKGALKTRVCGHPNPFFALTEMDRGMRG